MMLQKKLKDRKSTRLNSSHVSISYVVFCLSCLLSQAKNFPYTTLFRSKAHKDGIRKIVLDLRNNPGGLLDEAVKMVNIFVDKGKTAVQLEKGDHKEQIKTSNDASKEAK